MTLRVARVALPGVGDDAHGWAADGLSASRWHGGRGLALTCMARCYCTCNASIKCSKNITIVIKCNVTNINVTSIVYSFPLFWLTWHMSVRACFALATLLNRVSLSPPKHSNSSGISLCQPTAPNSQAGQFLQMWESVGFYRQDQERYPFHCVWLAAHHVLIWSDAR